ncbi:MAG: hypothetical protein V2A79_07505 [Planctomycetota bacterium]
MDSEFNHVDRQMAQWASKLRDDLNVPTPDCDRLATTLHREIAQLDAQAILSEIGAERVPIRKRHDELRAFQAWMDFAAMQRHKPEIVRAQVIVQNYMCFVYLGNGLFKCLLRHAGADTVTRKCCKFLTDNPVRAFRNAIAHANWTYTDDFAGIEFWARKGEDSSEPMNKFTVLQQDLNFWQNLARCTAYVAIPALDTSS